VEGWLIPKNNRKFDMRIRNNKAIYPVELNVRRIDVKKSYPEIPKEKTLNSGFEVEFDFEDGHLVIEINEGRGFKPLYSTELKYSIEHLPATLFNKDLSNNYPEHINLIENRQRMYYEDRREESYVRNAADPRLIALYLPQFHPFPENDKAWGKGFTEWSNVTTGQPRFIGHQQPILPKDLGYYDLRLENNILEQINLAKQHGVYGFCFYYYWFSGKKLMEGPLNSVLKHKDWDFNFTICWANENWTKRWDGRDSEVIIAQEYLDEDPLNFIKDVEHILLDPRYIHEDGKPVLMVYRASELKDPAHYTKVWREYFREKHNTELRLVTYLSFDDNDPRDYGFDAALDFAPHSAFFKNHLFNNAQFPYVDISNKLLDLNFSGVVADYRTIALNGTLDSVYDFPVYPCVTPSWDNDARKKGKGFVYQNSSPDIYASWLDRVVKTAVSKRDAPLVFINAWNEWAEGAILEPSMHLGHAVLNRTSEVAAQYSKNKNNIDRFPMYNITREKNKKLAVVVHLYYIDLWDEINAKLATIDEPYDLFITLNARDAVFTPTPASFSTQVFAFVIPNRGRDVLPFLYVARRIKAAGYEYILKIHSKKSKHRQDGSSWFSDMLDGLLPSQKVVNSIIKQLSAKETGIIGPENHLVSLDRHMGSNAPILNHLLSRSFDNKVAKKVLAEKTKYPYFGGTMFWVRTDMLDPILDLQLMPDDFQSEHGQIDGTTAHAVERLFGIAARLQNRKMYIITNAGDLKPAPQIVVGKYRYAP